jgi:3,5-dihydroxyphenylacetyl-CoA synthase
MLAVEICSACYYVDNTLETVVGNAICADGAAAFLLAADQPAAVRYPTIVDFETFLASEQIEEVGLLHQDGKLRIVLGASIHKVAGPMIAKALQHLLQRDRLSRSGIRFWVVHPGGRKVIDDVQAYLGLKDEVVRNGDPRPGDWGIMVALGPGMAAEVALLRW